MTVKNCSKCKNSLSLEDFAWKKKNRLRHAVCKSCQKDISRKHYRANAADQKSKSKIRRETKRDEVAKYLFSYFMENPCTDCGETNPVILEFDHRDSSEKSGTVSEMVITHSMELIEAEVAKCDVRCANCHRLKTARDFNWRSYQLWILNKDKLKIVLD